jgi:cystathionine gamma-synthase
VGALDPATLAVVLGRPTHRPGAAVNTPVVLSSTFRTGGPAIYGRDDNETREAFEAVLGGLEGGTALAFGSGMAAISAAVEMLPMGGAVVVAGDAYNGTRRLLLDSVARGRLTVRTADVADTDATLAACAEAALSGPRPGPSMDGFAGGGLLWLESPTNPLLAVADLGALIDGAHDRGLSVAVDNTFATPLLQRPLDLGADLVVHSVTKMLAGHSDVVMGAAVATSAPLLERLVSRRSLHGAIPGPFEAFLALRGVRTLPVRLERAQASAGEIARRLAERRGVAAVRYPGLATDPGHDRARGQMRGFGTMVSFDVDGGAEAAEAVCAAVRVLTPGTSLGGVETLIERRARWAGESHLPPGLLRLSVGVEAMEDLWSDLDQAIGSATGH